MIWVAAWLTLASPRMAVEAEIAHEHRVGVFPSGRTAVTGTSYDFSLNPTLEAGIKTRRANATIQYRPQFFVIPQLPDLFFFHGAGTDASVNLTDDWSVSAGFQIDAGELDISRELQLAAQRLNPNLPANDPSLAVFANSRIVNFRRINGSLSTSVQVHEDVSITLQANAGKTEPRLDDNEPTILLGENAGVGSFIYWLINPANRVSAELSAGTIGYEQQLYYRDLTWVLGYERVVTRRLSLLTRAGALFGNQINSFDLRWWKTEFDRGRLIAILISDLVVSGNLFRFEHVRGEGRLGVGTLPFYDPFRGTLDSRASIGASLDLQMGQQTRVELNVDYFTPADFAFLQGRDAQIASAPTTAVSDGRSVGFGVQLETPLNHIFALQTSIQVSVFLAEGISSQSFFGSMGVVGRIPLLDNGVDRRAIRTSR